jgi:alanine racemase
MAGRRVAGDVHAAADARPNVFDVDLGAIAHNVAVLRGVLAGGTRICAAVKANAYGFGLLPVARTLVGAGVDALGLVDIRDAVRLREDGIASPILMYAGSLLDERTMPRIREHGLTVTVGDERSLAVAASFGEQAPTRVFVEVDVGLERLGVSIDKAAGLLREAASSSAISLDGIYTHMHVPPDAAPQYLEWQFGRFQALLSAVQSDGYSTGIAMAASSPVLFRTTAMSLDAVDVGRYLYGIVRPGAEPGLAELGLRPAFGSLRSRISHCKRIERSGYLDAAPFAIRPGMRVGVVPMGFADGLASLTCGAALVRGVRAPLLGSLSLEHVSLDITGIPGVAAGDEVVFIGRQADAEITQEEVLASQRAGLPPACLSAAVRETVPRTYRPANARRSSAPGQRYTPFVEWASDVTTH